MYAKLVPILYAFSAIAISSARYIETNVDNANSTIFDLPMKIVAGDLLEQYGSFLLGNMNNSVNPCEDFYEYSCGNWKNSLSVPPKSRNDTFLHAIQHSLSELLVKFLSDVQDQELEQNTAEAKAKGFYRSCVQMSEHLEAGYKKFWEMRNKYTVDEQNMDWISINFMSSYEMYALLPLKTHYNSENRKIELMLTPPREILGNAEIVNVQNLTQDFKISDQAEKEEFTRELQQMIDFEKNLTALAKQRNETERLTLGDFLQRHKQNSLNWTRYFDVAFNGTQRNEWLLHNTIQDTTALEHFLQKTSLHTLHSYIRWRTLLKFYYIWKPTVENRTIEENCRIQTEQYFSYALVPFLIDTVFDEDRRADILQLAGHVKKVFYGIMDKQTWLDDETRSQAKTKLKAMDIQAGYTDELSHRELMNQAFVDVNITMDWFDNVLALEGNRAELRRKSVGDVLIPPPMHIRSTNAYYANFLNEAFVAIGISQFPFYHRLFPASLKFGGIGQILGHEIAHGFDSYCHNFNYDGKQRNWWTESSLRNFRERYRCLESQYNKFVYHGVATNGTHTLDDNIADNVGTRLSYYAYWQNYGQRDAEQQPLPGVSFNNKQLFFIKFAQTWCTNQDIAIKMQHVKTDEHAYEKFRVIGTLRNMPEFSEAFHCKLGAGMNPLKKCVIW